MRKYDREQDSTCVDIASRDVEHECIDRSCFMYKCHSFSKYAYSASKVMEKQRSCVFVLDPHLVVIG